MNEQTTPEYTANNNLAEPLAGDIANPPINPTSINEQANGRPEFIPEKFWDTEKNEIRIAQLAESYNALERDYSKKKNYEESYQKINQDYEQLQQELTAKNAEILDYKMAHHLGGAEIWQAVRPQIEQWVNDNLGDIIPDSLWADAEKLANIAKLFTETGQRGEKPITSSTNMPKLLAQNPPKGINENELRQLMKSPEYWQKGNKEVMAKVASGFEKLYAQ